MTTPKPTARKIVVFHDWIKVGPLIYECTSCKLNTYYPDKKKCEKATMEARNDT